MKPVVINTHTEKCGKCGFYVKKAYGLGTFTYGASESYEDWEVEEHNFCPNCGEKVDRD